jgi:hypothetical protein
VVTELGAPFLLQGLDSAEVALGQARRLGGGDGEALDPVVEVTVSVLDQPVDVPILVGGEDDADGRDVARCQASPAEEDVDEGTAGPAVAVLERVDRLELCVCDGAWISGGRWSLLQNSQRSPSSCATCSGGGGTKSAPHGL